MNKKRKIIVKIWIIVIVIIFLILLFLLGLSLPKLPLFKKPIQNQVKPQYQYQTQYVYDTNKVENIINLMNTLKRLKELKELKELQYQNQLETQQKSYDSIVKLPQPEVNYMPDKTKTNNTNNDELIKGIAITTLATGAVIIAAVVFPPAFASLGASLGKIAPVMTLLL